MFRSDYSYDRRAGTPSDQEDLEEVRQAIHSLSQGSLWSGMGASFKDIAARCPLSVTRIRSLVKKFPKVVASWFGGRDLEFDEAGTSGGSSEGQHKPFQPVRHQPQRYSPAGFRVVR